MTFKTFHIVQGLSRTPLLFIPRYLTSRFFKIILQKNKNLENHKSENMKIPKPRFTNMSPERLLKPWFRQISPTRYRMRRIVQLSRLLLVNLEKSGFRQKLFFW